MRGKPNETVERVFLSFFLRQNDRNTRYRTLNKESISDRERLGNLQFDPE